MELPTLVGSQVILRAPLVEDAEVLAADLQDPEVRRWLAFATKIRSLQEMRDFLERCAELRGQEKWFVFTIVDRSTGTPLGMTWFTQIVPRTRAEMGTWLARRAWGTGAYYEVKNLLMPFGFHELQLRRIEGRIAVSNVRMQRAFEHVGAVCEGRIREGFAQDGHVEDQFLYSVLASQHKAGDTPPVSAPAECVPCAAGIAPLRGAELQDRYRQLPAEWRLIDERFVEREYRFRNFRDALTLTDHLGRIAEQHGHHPQICLSWGTVRVTLTTNKSNGLTESDFVLAGAFDRAANGQTKTSP